MVLQHSFPVVVKVYRVIKGKVAEQIYKSPRAVSVTKANRETPKHSARRDMRYDKINPNKDPVLVQHVKVDPKTEMRMLDGTYEYGRNAPSTHQLSGKLSAAEKKTFVGPVVRVPRGGDKVDMYRTPFVKGAQDYLNPSTKGARKNSFGGAKYYTIGGVTSGGAGMGIGLNNNKKHGKRNYDGLPF